MPAIYARYDRTEARPGDLVVRLYHSGEEIRGYLRRVAEQDQEDAVFPGEEMQPDDVFRMAWNKNRDHPERPVLVELSEGVNWNPGWGKLA